jgi:hypothetical protein
MHILTAGSWTLYDAACLAAASGLLPFLDPPPWYSVHLFLQLGGKRLMAMIMREMYVISQKFWESNAELVPVVEQMLSCG